MATIGTSGAPSANTINYDALLSTTLFAIRDGMVDNIFKDSAFLAALRAFGGVEKQDGGERIQLPLMYETNSTVKSYSGYETIDTTPQDGMTSAFEEWREIAGTISISRKEERQNSGESAILRLLEQKTKQAVMSIREEVNKQLVQGTVSGTTFVPGNSVKDLNPLGYFLRKDKTLDPTTGGDVGNISNADNDWWRHRTADLGASSPAANEDFAISVTTYKGLEVAWRRMMNYCARGSGGQPNLVLADQVSYETYENARDDKVRFTSLKMADLGFDSIKLRGAEVIWDEQVPDLDSGTVALTTGSAFFINTEAYKFIIDSETDFVTTPFISPENQTAKVAKVLFMGNACVNNLRKLGMTHSISQSIVA